MRNLLWIAVAALVLAALAVPRLLSSGGGTDRAASNGDDDGAPLPVEVYTVTPQHLAETLTSTGTVFADERVEVVSEVAGMVRSLAFEEGTAVAAGALLVQIDDRELRAEQERVAARLELAERRARRQRQLFDDGLISDQDYDAAATEADALRAELRLIEVRIDKTQIRAPFAGMVGLRRLSEGAYVSPETLVTTLLDIDPVKLEFAVPERYAADFRPGKRVDFQVAGAGGARQATVYAVEPSVDPATRTVTVRATSPNPDGVLLPGAFADVSFAVRETDDALAVPSIAVLPELGGHRVYVLEDGAAASRPVETGLRTSDRVEITDGLATGDRVIISGLQSLRPGMAVEVVQ